MSSRPLLSFHKYRPLPLPTLSPTSLLHSTPWHQTRFIRFPQLEDNRRSGALDGDQDPRRVVPMVLPTHRAMAAELPLMVISHISCLLTPWRHMVPVHDHLYPRHLEWLHCHHLVETTTADRTASDQHHSLGNHVIAGGKGLGKKSLGNVKRTR